MSSSDEAPDGSQAPPAAEPPTRAPGRGSGRPARARLRATLASRSSLRDAFLLREVLGPPAGLREPGPRAPGG